MPKSIQELIGEESQQEPTEVPAGDTQPVATEGADRDVPVASPIRSFLTSNQFSIPDDIDDDTLNGQVLERLRRSHEVENELKQLRSQIEQQKVQEPVAPVQPTQPVEPVEPVAPEAPLDDIWSESYNLNPADIALATQADDGTFQPRDSSPDAQRAADSLNKAITLGNARIRQVASNPQAFFETIERRLSEKFKPKDFDEEAIVKKIAERIQADQQAREQEAWIDAWYKDNGPSLFRTDANGQILTDFNSKEPIRTEIGNRFNSAMVTLMELGKSEAEAIKTAWSLVAPLQQAAPQAHPVQSATQQPTVHAAPTAEDREVNRSRFLDREVPLPEPQTIQNGTGRPAPRNAMPSLTALVAQEQHASGV